MFWVWGGSVSSRPNHQTTKSFSHGQWNRPTRGRKGRRDRATTIQSLSCLIPRRQQVSTNGAPSWQSPRGFRAHTNGKPIKSTVFESTYRAYLNLKERNAREKDRLNKAEEWLAWGIVFTVVAGMIYLWASLPAKQLWRQCGGIANAK